MSGRLIGVGVGPGDPKLLTLRAVEAIASTRTVAYLAAEGAASLARAIAAAHLRPDHDELCFAVPMRSEPGVVAGVYDAMAARLAERLATGEDVAVLCLGDPLLYGTFIYLLDRLRAEHAYEVVPGITSASAAAARTGRVLARQTDGFAILPALLPDAALLPALRAADGAAILKVGARVARLKRLLAAAGRLDEALLVAWVGWPEETIVPFKDWTGESAPYFSLILTVAPR